jgi:hypothetical protein
LEQSKLIELLKTFTASELLAFRDFVASPYFNKREELVLLYAYLKKVAAEGYPEVRITRERLFAAAFPGEAFVEARLYHTMSRLYQCAMRFIQVEAQDEKPWSGAIAGAASLYRRKLPRHYSRAALRGREILEEQTTRDHHYFLGQFHISALEELYFSDLTDTTKSGQSIQAASDFLDRYYLSRKLRFLCVMLDRRHFLGVESRMELYAGVMQFLEGHAYLSEPAIAVYHAMVLAQTEAEPRLHFDRFLRWWRESVTVFTPYDQKTQLGLAVNFCIQQIRKGDKSYAEPLADLYREGLERRLLLEEGRISPWTFKNIVKLNLGLRRYDWVESFVLAYSSALHEDEREDAMHFNLAELYYHQGNFEQAQLHLVRVEFAQWRYGLGAKTLLAKIYCETREQEALDTLLSSFGAYLQRNQRIPKDVKMPYLNFVRILQKITVLPASRRGGLLDKIRATGSLTERSWLETLVKPAK